jgi:sugar phosphate isomerase/epimerase
MEKTPLPDSTGAAQRRVNWPVGCFNRPWTQWPFEQALQAVKAAGYSITGLLSRTGEEPFIGAEAQPDYLAHLQRRIAASGLTANLGALRSHHQIPLEGAIHLVRRQIDHAHLLGLQYVMSFGVDDPAEFDHYFAVMRDAAAYADERGIRLVMKPHGGISGSAEEILQVIRTIHHPNFSIWYDAGNIIHYTGKDPVAEIAPIAEHITGFCAKDCAERKGDVMIQFGAGKVDFLAVFQRLKRGGFNGPIMVECCKVGATPEETTVNARANRLFLEDLLAAL